MSMTRLASKSCFYTREKQEVAFDWLDPDEREAETGFGWAMKDNGVKPLCTQGWKGRLGFLSQGWKTLKKFHPWTFR
ncbi:hypothetical protein TNCV_3915471 [Trichonephila clavipes]|nr:hypothetical protein TNCV_3915471 [Trichonephila clavipes]